MMKRAKFRVIATIMMICMIFQGNLTTVLSSNNGVGNGEDPHVKISINTNQFIFDDKLDAYKGSKEPLTLTGSLEKMNQVKQFYYDVCNEKGEKTQSGKIKIESKWSISEINLNNGLNTITITAKRANGQAINKTIKFYNNTINMDSDLISIDMSTFIYYQEHNYYSINNKIDMIKGTLDIDLNKVKTFTYEIKDDSGIVLKKGSIDKSNNWSITDFGFIMGVNTLTIKAELNDNSIEGKCVKILCGNSDYINCLEIDTQDTDEDGLINYLEDYYFTNKNNADTDGDGLNDYIELDVLSTNPLNIDSDNNGITDADEDCDGEGLSNLSEIEINADPAHNDSDYDGVNDYDEINKYKTDILKSDSDLDGALDGWEIQNGFDPLVYNADFTLTITYGNENNVVVPSVTVNNVLGNQVGTLNIEKVVSGELADKNIPGYISNGFEFSMNGSFNSATISFQFDASLLEDATFYPAIYYYDENSQKLIELENQTINGNTVSVSTKHFSKYILLNKTDFDEVWNTEIKLPSNQTDNPSMDIVFTLDISMSMDYNDPNDIRKSLTNEFIDLLEDEDRAAAVLFRRNVSVLNNGTFAQTIEEKESLKNEVNAIVNDSGYGINAGTNGSLGLYTAINMFSDNQSYKCILFLSDGEDNYFSYNYDNLIQMAKDKNIIIYSIGLGNSIDESILQKIANETGGKYYFAEYANDLYNSFKLIKEETIDYTTDTNNDGISDYYTKLISKGDLHLGNGTNVFQSVVNMFDKNNYESEDAYYNAIYDTINLNSDYDGDGLINGDEIKITESNGYVYLYKNSDPTKKDSDKDGLMDNIDSNALKWDVCDRDLAIFAALSYEDGTNSIGDMYTANDIKGSETEPNETYYFLNGASIETGGVDAGIASEWTIVDYVNKWSDINTYFSATTYKNKNSIVIAYRGTNEPIGEWVNNIVGVGLLNYHSEEEDAREYAMKIVDKYPNCDIYITGHSLGGYLAQIGAAKVLENNSTNIKRISYFNGIGLKYNKLLFWTKNSAMDYLEEYNENGSLISYYIYGDVVSALGTHSGDTIGFYAANEPRNNHAGKYGTGFWTDLLSKSATGWLCVITGDNLAQYYEYYGTQSVMEYFWITHETDSFYYYLAQGTRSAY